MTLSDKSAVRCESFLIEASTSEKIPVVLEQFSALNQEKAFYFASSSFVILLIEPSSNYLSISVAFN